VPGRTPREALHAYVDPLQRALSCVTNAVLKHEGCDPLDTEKVLTTVPIATPLRAETRFFISVVQHYRVVEDATSGPFRISTAYYKYTLEDEEGDEILGYHWHPDGSSPYTRPHLHLGHGARIGRPDLEIVNTHLPTGRVALEDFVFLLIQGFKVKERRGDWEALLQAGAALFRKHGNWW
jgi:hypothetical protein